MAKQTTVDITCRDCGNFVQIELQTYLQHKDVKCHCGSRNLRVEQPPPTSAELVMAFQQLASACPAGCKDGAIEVAPGDWRICGACGGTSRR